MNDRAASVIASWPTEGVPSLMVSEPEAAKCAVDARRLLTEPRFGVAPATRSSRSGTDVSSLASLPGSPSGRHAPPRLPGDPGALRLSTRD
jgi:hypothetical protein